MFKLFSKILQIYKENILLKRAISDSLLLILSNKEYLLYEEKELKGSDMEYLKTTIIKLKKELNSYKQQPANKSNNA